MKIKLLTFHHEINYGANLQAYALKYYLEELGFEVEFIDFRRTKKYNKIVQFVRNNFSKSPTTTYKKLKSNILSFKFNSEKNRVFELFRQINIPLSNLTYNSIEDLRLNPPVADVYIVGSDQVWSEKIVLKNDFDVYFLDFGLDSIKRLSYAASSGGEKFSPDVESLIKNRLQHFDQIGVREFSLKSYMESLDIPNLRFTPDPTFLINWADVIKSDFSSKEKKIGAFCLSPNNQEKLFLALGHLMEESPYMDSEFMDLSRQVLSPFDWIKQIALNQVFLTDSYHAVLFSLFTSTPFFFIKWGEGYKRDQRIIELLELFDLEDLAIDESDIKAGFSHRLDDIHWDNVAGKIIELRLIGKKFLNETLD